MLQSILYSQDKETEHDTDPPQSDIRHGHEQKLWYPTILRGFLTNNGRSLHTTEPITEVEATRTNASESECKPTTESRPRTRSSNQRNATSLLSSAHQRFQLPPIIPNGRIYPIEIVNLSEDDTLELTKTDWKSPGAKMYYVIIAFCLDKICFPLFVLIYCILALHYMLEIS